MKHVSEVGQGQRQARPRGPGNGQVCHATLCAPQGNRPHLQILGVNVFSHLGHLAFVFRLSAIDLHQDLPYLTWPIQSLAPCTLLHYLALILSTRNIPQNGYR